MTPCPCLHYSHRKASSTQVLLGNVEPKLLIFEKDVEQSKEESKEETLGGGAKGDGLLSAFGEMFKGQPAPAQDDDTAIDDEDSLELGSSVSLPQPATHWKDTVALRVLQRALDVREEWAVQFIGALSEKVHHQLAVGLNFEQAGFVAQIEQAIDLVDELQGAYALYCEGYFSAQWSEFMTHMANIRHNWFSHQSRQQEAQQQMVEATTQAQIAIQAFDHKAINLLSHLAFSASESGTYAPLEKCIAELKKQFQWGMHKIKLPEVRSHVYGRCTLLAHDSHVVADAPAGTKFDSFARSR